MIEIRPIPLSQVTHYWGKASKLIAPAVEMTMGEWDLPTLFETIKSGGRALFCIFKDGKMIAAVTTRIETYPTGKKAVTIDFAGGEDFKSWSNFTDYIEPLYKSLGCDNMYIAGRLGWLRLHTDKGFKSIYHVIGKSICPVVEKAENKPQQV